MPSDLAVLIVNSNVRRGLVDSEYNTRRQQCEAAARHYGVKALRDLDLAALEAGKAGWTRRAIAAPATWSARTPAPWPPPMRWSPAIWRASAS